MDAAVSPVLIMVTTYDKSTLWGISQHILKVKLFVDRAGRSKTSGVREVAFLSMDLNVAATVSSSFCFNVALFWVCLSPVALSEVAFLSMDLNVSATLGRVGLESSVSVFSRLLGSACTELYRKPLQISSQALLFLAELGCYQGRRVRLQTPQTIIMIARDAFSGSSVSPFTAWGSSRSRPGFINSGYCQNPETLAVRFKLSGNGSTCSPNFPALVLFFLSHEETLCGGREVVIVITLVTPPDRLTPLIAQVAFHCQQLRVAPSLPTVEGDPLTANRWPFTANS
ncbi:hypothetical protein RRG08_009602 [Elysia crispata]|uniref:Uncharacterized protein n=1 Tax=Elysia crispata TaxID=231223 RepID=A0AAE1CM22_9GAST|nr:hypothetical protein RRG08_009602 [Elysia crispata]